MKASSQIVAWALITLAVLVLLAGGGCESKPKTFTPKDDPTGKRFPPRTVKKTSQTSRQTPPGPATTAYARKR